MQRTFLRYNSGLYNCPISEWGRIAQLVERLAFCFHSHLLCFTNIIASSKLIAGNTAHGPFWASVHLPRIHFQLFFCRISHTRTGNFAIDKKNPDDNTRGVQFRCWEEITQKKSNINDVFIAHMSRILPWRRNITSQWCSVQGLLITDGRNSSKVTGPTVG